MYASILLIDWTSIHMFMKKYTQYRNKLIGLDNGIMMMMMLMMIKLATRMRGKKKKEKRNIYL